MNAKKCDRCGILYEIYNTAPNAKRTNGIMLLNIAGNGEQYYKQNTIELCPVCNDELRHWLKQGKDKDDE